MSTGITRKLWDEKNKEHIRLQKKEYYLKNKEHIDARNAKYSLENRNTVYEQQRKWREQKRLKNLAIRPKRILLEENETRAYKNVFGDLREIVIQRDGEKCVDCGMTRKEHKKLYGVDITVDHENGIGSKSEIPDNRLENLRTRCLRCHGKKDVKRMKKLKK